MYLRAKALHSADKPDEARGKRIAQRLEALTLVTACRDAGAWITKSEINICNRSLQTNNANLLLSEAVLHEDGAIVSAPALQQLK